jgi:hypothetical protein
VLRTALGHALVLGILFAAMSLLGPWFFRLTGQPEQIVEKAGSVTLIFGLGLPGFLCLSPATCFWRRPAVRKPAWRS